MKKIIDFGPVDWEKILNYKFKNSFLFDSTIFLKTDRDHIVVTNFSQEIVDCYRVSKNEENT